MKYEVPIVYVGLSNFIVEASSPKEAEMKARERFANGDSPDVLGNESENIEIIGVITEVK